MSFLLQASLLLIVRLDPVAYLYLLTEELEGSTPSSPANNQHQLHLAGSRASSYGINPHAQIRSNGFTQSSETWSISVVVIVEEEDISVKVTLPCLLLQLWKVSSLLQIMSTTDHPVEPAIEKRNQPEDAAKTTSPYLAEEKCMNNTAVIRDITIGFADGLTVPFALTAGLASLVYTSYRYLFTADKRQAGINATRHNRWPR